VVLWLIQANALLALFNMLPAFPLDGGRVARALLAFVMPYRRATLVAAFVGQGLALLLGIWGVMGGNVLLIATALFIFLAARQEVAATAVAGILGNMRVADALAPRPAVVEVGQRVRDALDAMAATGQGAAAVLHSERPIGIVLGADAQAAVAAGRGEMWVTMAMRRHFVTVQAGDTLDQARITMAEQNTPVVAVFDGEAFAGLLTIEEIAAAFSRRDRGHPPARPEATTSA
ncbi:MAG TPA: CBS domain-containing protein, partial [Chloroflexaceae bacterium]|nr:CBS domain-containing protein [Chloroflexaceae bacterium]